MKSSIKWVIFIGLLAALFVIAACAPKEAGEEGEQGALAGQASGFGCSPVLQNVKSCTDAGTSVSGEKQNGQSFSYTDSCVSGNKKLREHQCYQMSTRCPPNTPAGQCPPPTWMVVRCTTSCPSNQCDLNTKQCVAPLPVCGNDVKEGTEACDGTDLGGSALATCNAQMGNQAATGTVACSSDCASFDLSGCEVGEEFTSETICDAVDNDGDSLIDDGCDDDNDGFCDQAMSMAFPPGYLCPASWGLDDQPNNQCCQVSIVTSKMDCNDLNRYQRPNGDEVCGNGLDDNCNGQVDEIACPVTDTTDATAINAS